MSASRKEGLTSKTQCKPISRPPLNQSISKCLKPNHATLLFLKNLHQTCVFWQGLYQESATQNSSNISHRFLCICRMRPPLSTGNSWHITTCDIRFSKRSAPYWSTDQPHIGLLIRPPKKTIICSRRGLKHEIRMVVDNLLKTANL